MRIRLTILSTLCLLSWNAIAGVTWTKPFLELPDAKVNETYSFDLNQFVEGSEGETLTFSVIAGPAWISLSADGVLSGTPSQSDVGKTLFRLAVKGTESGAIATASLRVAGEEGETSLTCRDGSKAHHVGTTADRTHDIFSCRR